MASAEGVANSYADLLTAIETAMLANGWAKSGAVLHADGCFVELAVDGTTVTLRGGAGLTGGNALLSPGPNVVRIGNSGVIMQMTFPVAYNIALHASPREVYVNVNYAVDTWQFLAFGRSGVSLPGSGVWYSASFSAGAPSVLQITPSRGVYSSGVASSASGALFWGAGGFGSQWSSSYIHCDIDGVSWSPGGYGQRPVDGSTNIPYAASGLLDRQPSAMNGAAILLPCALWIGRPGSTVSLVADFSHCRVLRIDNIAPSQILDYAGDRWKIYPFFRKSTLERDGGNFSGASAPAAHTGTMGMAVRYDGP